MIKKSKNYEEFKGRVKKVLKRSKQPLSWAEIKARAGFKQKVPNNAYVRQMEEEGLTRERGKGGKILWRLT